MNREGKERGRCSRSTKKVLQQPSGTGQELNLPSARRLQTAIPMQGNRNGKRGAAGERKNSQLKK